MGAHTGQVTECVAGTYAVQDNTLTAPPVLGEDQDGYEYFVATGATGAWVGQDLNIAVWVWDYDTETGSWSFVARQDCDNVHVLGGANAGNTYVYIVKSK